MSNIFELLPKVSAWTAELRFFGAEGGRSGGDGSARGPRVTRAEKTDAVEGLSRFVEMGGRIDEGRIPDHKPVLQTFVLDDRDRFLYSEEILSQLARIRDIETGPDGYIYLLLEHAEGGQIIRLVPDEAPERGSAAQAP